VNCTVTLVGVLLKAVVSCHVPSVTFAGLGLAQQPWHAEPSDHSVLGWYTGCAPVTWSPFSSSMVIFLAPARTNKTRLSSMQKRKKSTGIVTGWPPGMSSDTLGGLIERQRHWMGGL
jgi:hypothetical protein